MSNQLKEIQNTGVDPEPEQDQQNVTIQLQFTTEYQKNCGWVDDSAQCPSQFYSPESPSQESPNPPEPLIKNKSSFRLSSQTLRKRRYHSLFRLRKRRYNKLFTLSQRRQDESFKLAQRPLFRLRKRIYHQIQTSYSYQKKYIDIKKGKPSQTKDLLKHEKVRVLKFLEMKYKCNVLTKRSKQIYKKFKKIKKISHHTFQQCYGVQKQGNLIKVNADSDQIRQQSLKIHQSSKYLKSIFNGNMNFMNKLNSIKYLGKFEQSVRHPETFTKFK